MDFYDVVNSRRTIRDFSDKEVSPEIVKRVLEAGIKAPSNDHLRNWEFVVICGTEAINSILQKVPDSAKRQIKALQDRKLDELQKKMYFDAVPKQQRMLSQSGCLILPFFKQTGDLLQPKNLSSLNAFATIWCCIENVLLAATAEGLCCALRVPMGEESEYVSKLVHAPDGYVMPCYIAMGYPSADAVMNEQERVSIKDKIHYDRW